MTTKTNSPFTWLSPAGWEHKKRCKSLPPLTGTDAERLITDFVVTRGVTRCPPRYSASVEPSSRLARTSGTMDPAV